MLIFRSSKSWIIFLSLLNFSCFSTREGEKESNIFSPSTLPLTFELSYEKDGNENTVSVTFPKFPTSVSRSCAEDYWCNWDVSALDAIISHNGLEKNVKFEVWRPDWAYPTWAFYSSPKNGTQYTDEQDGIITHTIELQGASKENRLSLRKRTTLTTSSVNLKMQGYSGNTPEMVRRIYANLTKNSGGYIHNLINITREFPLNTTIRNIKHCNVYFCRWKETLSSSCGISKGTQCANDSCEVDLDRECYQ